MELLPSLSGIEVPAQLLHWKPRFTSNSRRTLWSRPRSWSPGSGGSSGGGLYTLRPHPAHTVIDCDFLPSAHPSPSPSSPFLHHARTADRDEHRAPSYPSCHSTIHAPPLHTRSCCCQSRLQHEAAASARALAPPPHTAPRHSLKRIRRYPRPSTLDTHELSCRTGADTHRDYSFPPTSPRSGRNYSQARAAHHQPIGPFAQHSATSVISSAPSSCTPAPAEEVERE